jgi:hypothetical protein
MYHGAYHRRQPRETVGTLALRVGRGCAELHDRMMVGVRTSRNHQHRCRLLVSHHHHSAASGRVREPRHVLGQHQCFGSESSGSRLWLAFLDAP